MNKPVHRMIMTVCACLAPIVARGADPDPRLPAIIKQLASADYQTRESGQTALDTIAPDQVEQLRALAKIEPDPEIKTRLTLRIDAMDLYNLIHPPRLSLKVSNASLAQIAGSLNQQIGAHRINAIGDIKFTLQAENQSFWEIFRQLNQQHPISFMTMLVSRPVSDISPLELAPATAPIHCTFVDLLAMKAPIVVKRGANFHMIEIQTFADPRIRVDQYVQFLQPDKITDQDGKSLLSSVSQSPRVGILEGGTGIVPGWVGRISLVPPTGTTRISLLRVNMAYTVQINRHLKLDPTRLRQDPLETPLGNLVMEKWDNQTLMLLAKPRNATDPLPRTPPTTLLLTDAAGNSHTTTITDGKPLRLNLLSLFPDFIPATLDITWPESSPKIDVPVEFTDIDLSQK